MDYGQNKDLSNKIKDKIEKLASAVFIATDHLSDKESIKFDVRSHGATVVSFVSTYLRVSPFDRETLFTDIDMTVDHILALLRVMNHAQIVKFENANILISEYQSFINSLREYHGGQDLRGGQTLAQDFFGEPLSVAKNDFLYRSDSHVLDKSNNDHKKTLEPMNAPHQIQKDKSTFFIEKKTDRKKQILDIIKDKQEVTIKDITNVIKDCSEKTIQRELIALVESKILVRKGDKRWSKYSLNEVL